MKNFKLFLMMFCATLTLGTFTACDDDDDAPHQSGLIGNWIQTEAYSSTTISFLKNGTGKIHFEYKTSTGTDGVNETFEYTIDKDDSYLVIIGSTLEGSYDVTVTNSVLQLVGESYRFELTRVK